MDSRSTFLHAHVGFEAQRRRRTVERVNGYPLHAPEGAGRAAGLPAASPCVPASKKSAALPKCAPYQNRHRWEGASIPRRARETSLRNSAK